MRIKKALIPGYLLYFCLLANLSTVAGLQAAPIELTPTPSPSPSASSKIQADLINSVIDKNNLPSAGMGVESGGGGTTIRFPGQRTPFLLDRLMIDQTLADRSEPVSNPIYLSYPSLENQPEIGPLLSEDLQVLSFAKRTLEIWKAAFIDHQAASLELILLIEQAIDRMSFLRTTHRFRIMPRYVLPPTLSRRKFEIETAVLYVPEYGAILSAPAWDALDVETQAGLIVHESLRQVQNLYGFTDLSDAQLQVITAVIMDVQASAEFSLETFMSTTVRRLCVVRAIGKKSQDPAARLMATIAGSLDDDLEQVLDAGQQQRAGHLVRSEQSDAEFKRLLKQLIKAKILK